MQDKSERHQATNRSIAKAKRLGGYLIEAGLLTSDQVNVALNDQHSTGMRFGEIIVARGWVKEQTIEWVMEKVVVPEKRALQRKQQVTSPPSTTHTIHQTVPQTTSQSNFKASAPAPQEPPNSVIAQAAPSDSGTKRHRFPRVEIIFDNHPSPKVEIPPVRSSEIVDSSHDENGSNVRRDISISKPLPSVQSTDGDVSWVG